MMGSRVPRLPSATVKAILFAWMIAVGFVFVAVSMSADGPVAAVMPDWILRLRILLLPWFSSQSIY